MLRVMFLHCWRISLVCLALKLVGSWVELGFSVGMEAFGYLEIREGPEAWNLAYKKWGEKELRTREPHRALLYFKMRRKRTGLAEYQL